MTAELCKIFILSIITWKQFHNQQKNLVKSYVCKISYRTVFEKTNWKTENLYILGHRGPYEALK